MNEKIMERELRNSTGFVSAGFQSIGSSLPGSQIPAGISSGIPAENPMGNPVGKPARNPVGKPAGFYTRDPAVDTAVVPSGEPAGLHEGSPTGFPSGSPGAGKVEELIHKAYESLKKSSADIALGFLREAMKVDCDHKEVLYALKCLNWWLAIIKRLEINNDFYVRGDYILSQWKSYYAFLERIGDKYDSCQYAIKRFVYLRALDYFLEPLKEGINQQDPVLLLQIGRCCKGAGNWDEALRYLEQAGRYKREDSTIISELADVRALLGDARAAKVLFREAFFLDPQGIDLSAMESEMILALRDKVKVLGHTGTETAEWMPVWGCIWGIFSVNRALKPVELSRLKQSIYSLESELRNKSGSSPHILPRLLNRYFWLIDYCEQNRDNSKLMDETMLKIKFIAPAVYKHYKT